MGDQLTLKGVVICPGIGIGRVALVDTEVTVQKRKLAGTDVVAEQERYTRAAHMAQQHVIAHRAGAAHAPKNILAAMRQVLHEGVADIVEVDVTQTIEDYDLDDASFVQIGFRLR